MRYDAVLLDADDTLLDFARSEESAFTLTSETFGLPSDAGRVQRYSEINRQFWKQAERGEITVAALTVQRFARLFEEEGLAVDPVAFDAFYREHLGDFAYVRDDAVETLATLAPSVPLYIVTNGIAAIQRRRLTASGLLVYIKDVFISEEIGATKPDTAFFDAVCAAIPYTREHLLICGDSPTSDIRGGHESGIDTCLLDPTNVYPSVSSTYTIRTLRELPAIVRGI